jgi:hypothetical protein
LALLAIFGSLVPKASAANLLSDNFDQYPNGVITTEQQYWGGGGSPNPVWEITSGILYADNHAGWTGVPTATNNSVVFRLNTKRTDFKDVVVTLDLLNSGLTTSSKTPAVAWDGMHIWLRYQSEYQLYYTSINRRDNTVLIKKKVPGGPSNGGTYYTLSASKPYAVPYGQWQHIKASAKNNSNGSVTISLYANDVLLVQAVDDGHLGGAPITGAGRVGIRGDNANLHIDNFTVTDFNGTPTPTPTPSPSNTIPSAPTGLTTMVGNNAFRIAWKPVPGATSYNVYRAKTSGVTKSTGYKIANVTNPYISAGTSIINNTPYYAIVTAVNSLGESIASAQVTATPKAMVPYAPDGVVATPGNQSFSVSWNPVPGAVSYNLYRSRFSDVNKATGYKIANVTSPYISRDFANGQSYYMVVTAVNALGESIESTRVQAVPNASLAALAAGLDAARVYPTPWKSNLHSGLPITFDGFTVNSTVKIFTIAGNWVKTLPSSNVSTTWDLKTDSGEDVASGLYLYLIEDDAGDKAKGVLSVIR